MSQIDKPVTRNQYGQRISRITNKRLPSKKTLHNAIALAKLKQELYEQLLLEHLEVQ